MFPSTMITTTKHTVELREIIEGGYDIWSREHWDGKTVPYYSFTGGWAESDLDRLKRKFEAKYWFRQIGQETVERFMHYLKARWYELLPYYTELYRSVCIMEEIEDPFGNVDVTETYTETRTSNTSSTSSASGESSTSFNSADDKTRISSDTPRGSVSDIEQYMTNAEKEDGNSNGTNSSESTSQGTSSGESTESTTHTFRKTGNQGVNTYAHDMIEYRKTIINIEKMFVDEFNDLFLGVY